MITQARLTELLTELPRRTIGVVGDLGLDGYWYADMTRSVLSRETPRFPRPIVRESYAPGAGANVARNLRVLGVGRVLVFSVLGDDWRGMLLQRELERYGVTTDALLRTSGRVTPTFVKPILLGYDSQQEDARIDFENVRPLTPALEEALISTVTRHLPRLDALLVADQLDANGVITDRVREALNHLAAEHPQPLFIADSRRRIGLFRHMLLKPNRVEAVAALAPDADPRTVSREELIRIGQTLSRRSERPVVITLGGNGALLCDGETSHHLPPAPVRPPLDPVGAGDAFVAALAAALTAGADLVEAGTVANLAAAVTVEKLNQTGTASPDELLARCDMALKAEATP